MEFKNVLQSRKIVWLLTGIGALIIALLILDLGMYIGYNKATDAYLWGELDSRIDQATTTPQGRGPSFLGMGGNGISDTQGDLGQIVRVNLPNSIIVEEQNDTQKTILISSTTAIREFKETLMPGDLTIGSSVVIFGPPNDQGQVEAELIRVLPLPPGAPSTAASAQAVTVTN